MRNGYEVSFFGRNVHYAYDWGGHWTFGASRNAGLSVYIHVKPRGGLRPRYERAIIGGRAATIFSFPQRLPASFSGHVGVVWKQRGTTRDISVHGHAWRPRVVAMARALMDEIDACASDAARATPPCAGLRLRIGRCAGRDAELV
jgi:hypothetical protein